MNTKQKATTGKRSAQDVRDWLNRGGRDEVRKVLRTAVERTREKNKARELEPDFLERRVTF